MASIQRYAAGNDTLKVSKKMKNFLHYGVCRKNRPFGPVLCILYKYAVLPCSWGLSVLNKTVLHTCEMSNKRYTARRSFPESFEKIRNFVFSLLMASTLARGPITVGDRC